MKKVTNNDKLIAYLQQNKTSLMDLKLSLEDLSDKIQKELNLTFSPKQLKRALVAQGIVYDFSGGVPPIDTLRKKGYKVRVTHRRNWLDGRTPFVVKKVPGLATFQLRYASPGTFKLEGKGGVTEVEVETPNGEHVVGVSRCSKVDFYNRQAGFHKAYQKALSQLGLV